MYLCKTIKKTKMEKNLQTIIKNASRRMKINNNEWHKKGYNMEYIPNIYIFENGYIVGMYHQASCPQLCYREEKVYGKELGKFIINCSFEGHVLKMKTQDIIDWVNLKIKIWSKHI